MALFLLTIVIVLLVEQNSSSAQTFAFRKVLDDPTNTGSDEFGSSVALSGNRALVGARGDAIQGYFVGQAHLYDVISGDLLHTFNDPTPTFADTFGSTVDLNEDYVLIGAPRHGANSVNDHGQAHLFDPVTGNLLLTFDDPTPSNIDSFGSSVAVNGGLSLIGAPYDDTDGSQRGQVHLFDSISGNLVRTFHNPSPLSDPGFPGNGGLGFGESVALTEEKVLVGAPLDNTNGFRVGRAFLFSSSTGNLLQIFEDPTPTNADHFGFSVAINTNYVLIGAPMDDTDGERVGQAHLYDAVSGDLLHTFSDPTAVGSRLNEFGTSVAIDGSNVLIGASKANGFVGQAHLFDATTGELLQTFDDPTLNRCCPDYFGSAVAIDGKNILIGASNDASQGTNIGQSYHFSVPEPATISSLMSTVLALMALRPRRSHTALV